MNERIDELMIEAGARFEFLHGVHYDDFDYRMFAELIVRECVRVCNKQTPNWKGEYATAFGDGVEFCISGIKEHFGVEE